MQQRARGANPQWAAPYQRLQAFKPAAHIGTPDVTAIDHPQRQHPLFRQCVVQDSGIIFACDQIHMQALHWQFADGVEVMANAIEIGGQQ
ncbi:hypothetical protein D3C75_1210890 [compost metagenome]